MAYSYALILIVRSPGKTFRQCQKQSNEDARWVCVQTTLFMLVSQWCIFIMGDELYIQVYCIHIGVKFGVARFDTMGNFQDALNDEASDE